MSYSSDGYVPVAWAVDPSTSNFTNPTGAGVIANCPSLLVVTAGAAFPADALACASFVSRARSVTPGIGTLLLSSTTPAIVVCVGSPGVRPDAVKLTGSPWLPWNVAVATLLLTPS